MRTWLIDLKPLRLYPSYRRLWVGSTVSTIGNHLTLFAVTIQIYTLTNDSLAIGAIGLFTGIPSLILALCGGVLGDRYDRRQIILNTTFLQLVGCTILWIYTLLGGSSIIVLYCLVGWVFLLGSINVPVGSAILPRLVDKEHLQSAIALRVFTMHSTMFLGPLIGGFLLTKYNIATLYFIDMCTFCVTLYGIFRLPSIGHTTTQERKS
jgi:MFS family permease